MRSAGVRPLSADRSDNPLIGKRVVSRSSAIVGNGECDHGNRRPSQEIASRHWLVMPTDSGFHARRSIERSATPAIQDLRRFLASWAPWAFVSQSQQLGQVSAFHGGRAPIQSLAPCPLIRRAIAGSFELTAVSVPIHDNARGCLSPQDRPRVLRRTLRGA